MFVGIFKRMMIVMLGCGCPALFYCLRRLQLLLLLLLVVFCTATSTSMSTLQSTLPATPILLLHNSQPS